MINRTRKGGRELHGCSVAQDDRILRILSVGTQGDGLGEGIFAPLTLPGELARVAVEDGRARVIEVLEASPDRIEPPCPHFGDCGGCALQHWRAEPYLAWKVEQIRVALARERLEGELLAPVRIPIGARRRVALHARRAGGSVVLGYKARRAWRVTQVDRCIVAAPAINEALAGLRALAEPFLEHPASAPILHVTATLTGLDIDVTGVERRGGSLSADARSRIPELADALDAARVSLAGEILYLARPPLVRLGEATVAPPPGSFLQAAAEAEAALVAFALESAQGARRIADLYCGLGTFALPLARVAPVIAWDASGKAVAALRKAQATTPGLKSIVAEPRDLDRRPILSAELSACDVVLFDPPRAGAAVQSREIARSTCRRVVAVSCNAATFARDARTLVDGGFRLGRVLPVDQFLWSPHIELAAEFTRPPG